MSALVIKTLQICLWHYVVGWVEEPRGFGRLFCSPTSSRPFCALNSTCHGTGVSADFQTRGYVVATKTTFRDRTNAATPPCMENAWFSALAWNWAPVACGWWSRSPFFQTTSTVDWQGPALSPLPHARVKMILRTWSVGAAWPKSKVGRVALVATWAGTWPTGAPNVG